MSAIHRVQAAVAGCQTLIIQTGGQHELRLERGQRQWLCDDGVIDDADRARGGVVSNLPAGSIYTTVLEHATQGRLWLPQAGDARDVVLSFEDGRIAQITAQHAETLHALFERHTGEPRRVGHIGIGLNPQLDRLIGWTLVDEHVEGCLFISLGENRYMGGQNESSLNVDYAIPAATLIADGRMIVAAGKLVV
jgi:leucyl aminopeptidase (aminopeptidase T)